MIQNAPSLSSKTELIALEGKPLPVLITDAELPSGSQIHNPWAAVLITILPSDASAMSVARHPSGNSFAKSG
ncbi:MAG: hypothetical protein BWY82_02108 [Verrucomicrobia bacterium ADurb.Bin474]|nr:MAG: hypothetical protein BWY82_02108 [Verrucomicrobia bacterium ADurb.Bin474]